MCSLLLDDLRRCNSGSVWVDGGRVRHRKCVRNGIEVLSNKARLPVPSAAKLSGDARPQDYNAMNAELRQPSETKTLPTRQRGVTQRDVQTLAQTLTSYLPNSCGQERYRLTSWRNSFLHEVHCVRCLVWRESHPPCRANFSALVLGPRGRQISSEFSTTLHNDTHATRANPLPMFHNAPRNTA